MSFNLSQPPVNLGGVLVKYYVRTSGSDTTGTGTLANPWRTVAFALTQLAASVYNGVYFIDCTGITETLTKRLPNLGGTPLSFIVDSAAIQGFLFSCLLCLHADLTVFAALSAGSILSVAANATTTMKEVTTSGGLTVNQFRGKIVRQAGAVKGTVASNDATVIKVSGTLTITAGVAIDICDPGATLSNMEVVGQTNGLVVEGISLQTTGTIGLTAVSNPSTVSFDCCKIAAVSARVNADLNIANSHITGGGGGFSYDGNVAVTNSLVQSINFTGSITTGLYSWRTQRNTYLSCGPLASALNGPQSGTMFIDRVEFVTPTSSVLSMEGSGSCNITSVLINNSAAGPLSFNGPIKVGLSNIPAGTGNAGIGATLSNGAQVGAVFANVALTGAGGDVKIGGLAATTWILNNAAPGNRLTDTGANGDNSSSKAA